MMEKLTEGEEWTIGSFILERLEDAGELNPGDTVVVCLDAMVRGPGKDDRSRSHTIRIERRPVTDYVELAPRAAIVTRAFNAALEGQPRTVTRVDAVCLPTERQAKRVNLT